MKKKIVAIVCILFMLITLIVVPSCSGNPSGAPSIKDMISKKLPKAGQLKCDEYRCYILFGCTPKEFLNGEFDAFNEIGYLCDSAKIDSDGFLIVNFTSEHVTKFRNSDFLTNFDEYENIDVSSDFTEITVYGYEDTILDDVDYSVIIAEKMALIQRMDGIDIDEINILYQIEDGITHDVVYTTSWDNGWYYSDWWDDIINAILEYWFDMPAE